MTKKIMVVFGTRPEAIKLAPVIAALRARPDEFETVVCSTGQHREMLIQALDTFGLKPEIDLDIMRPDQTLPDLTALLVIRLGETIAAVRPDRVIVQGDTTTAFVAALAAYYAQVPVAHVEAGLRSHDRNNPFPEEINRRVADMTADLCFAPTEGARQALLREGCREQDVHVTGNTVIDALLEAASMAYDWEAGPVAKLPRDRRLATKFARRNLDVLRRDGAHHVVDGQRIFVELVGIEPDPHGVFGAEQREVADAWNSGQRILQ